MNFGPSSTAPGSAPPRTANLQYAYMDLMHISDTQLGYITDVPAGCGLIRCGGQLVPFTNAFPTGTDLYKLMTTKPDEMMR